MSKVQMMSEELPILKGILKGNVSYHNARRCPIIISLSCTTSMSNIVHPVVVHSWSKVVAVRCFDRKSVWKAKP